MTLLMCNMLYLLWIQYIFSQFFFVWQSPLINSKKIITQYFMEKTFHLENEIKAKLK